MNIKRSGFHPAAHTAPADHGEIFRPTMLMERVSRYLESQPGPADRTARQIRERVEGKEATVLKAADALVTEGYATTERGPRNATVYVSAKPYRVCDEGHQS